MMFGLLLAMMAGCDGGDVRLGDELPTDAALPDSMPPVGELAVVRIEDYAGPLRDVAVIFHDSQGVLLSQAVTDDAGEVADDVPRDASVTVLTYGSLAASMYELTTIMGVQPGDRIVLHRGADPRLNDTVSTVDVAMPGRFGSAAASYAVSTCASGWGSAFAPSVSLDVARRCLDSSGRFRVFAHAQNTLGDRVAFAWLDAHADRPATRAVLPAWSTDFWSLTANVTNLPTDITTQRVGASLAGVGTSHEGSFPAVLRIPRVDGGARAHSLYVAWNDPERDSFSALTRSDAIEPTSIDLDGGELLPRVSNVATDSSTSPALVHFRRHGDFASADAVRIDVSWEEPSPHYWAVYAPPTLVTPIELPDLPVELHAWRLTEGTVATHTSITYWDSSAVDGYDDVRAAPRDAFYSAPLDEATVRTSQGWQ